MKKPSQLRAKKHLSQNFLTDKNIINKIIRSFNLEKNDANLSFLNHEIHLKLCKYLSNWPKIIEASAIYKEPHRIAFYLIELSSIFHSLWSLGREQDKLRFFQENNTDCTYAYLSLIKATKIVIASGLNVMSVSAPEEM